MHYVDYKEVGKRISKRRKDLGYKQAQVTEMAELSDKYLSNIERATSIVSIDVLMKLCDVLESTPNDFLLGTTNDETSIGNEKYLIEKFSTLPPKKKAAVISFIDWISENGIE